jgi:hypothetical protein
MSSLVSFHLQGCIDTLDGSRDWFLHSGWQVVVQAMGAASGDELALTRADASGLRCGSFISFSCMYCMGMSGSHMVVCCHK